MSGTNTSARARPYKEISRWDRNLILVQNAVTKYKLGKRDGERCNICKERHNAGDMTIDHIEPRCFGGSDDFKNKQLLCIECHRKKTKSEQLTQYAVKILTPFGG